MEEITLEKYVEINRPSMEIHTDAIIIKDTDLIYVYVNPKYLEVSPNSKKDIIGYTTYNFVSKEKAEEYHRTDRQVLATGKPQIYEQQIDTANQVDANYLITKAPILDLKGDIIGILVSARSIEHYIATREELQTNLNLIEILLDSIPYPIFIKDTEGMYLKVNHAYASNLGQDPEDIIGHTDIDLFGQSLGAFYRTKDKAVLENEARDIYISTGVNQHLRYITTKDILKNGKGDIIGVIGIVNTYQELTGIRDDIINMQRIESISQLAGGIAHDLNNILTNITMLVGVLLNSEDDSEKIEDLETIETSIQKASDLINKLRTFARKSDLNKKPVRVNNLVKDALQLVLPKYKENLEVETYYADVDPVIIGDTVQLSQMVMNLVVNAIDAVGTRGQISISIYQEVLNDERSRFVFQPEAFTGGEYVCIQVSDTGSGISSSHLNQIFDPYFSTKEVEGTGLGLSIVYGVIRSHEGVLELTTSNEGTTFQVYLPAHD